MVSILFISSQTGHTNFVKKKTKANDKILLLSAVKIALAFVVDRNELFLS